MVDIGESWAVTTLAERPELLDAAIGLGMLDETAAFMSSNLVGLITSPSRFRDLWPELAVIVLDASGAVIARAFAVSCATSGGHARAELPNHGWEAVLIWAAEDKLDHCRPDTAAAVTVTVAPTGAAKVSALLLSGHWRRRQVTRDFVGLYVRFGRQARHLSLRYP